jgi:type 1 glutamine amidotransferase
MLIVTQVAPYAAGTPYGPGPAGVHGVLPQAASALSELATLQGLTPSVVKDVRTLTFDELAGARVLCLFTIGETPFSPEQQSTIESSWSNGELALLGVHSATDSSYGWPAFQKLMGARFDGHPWTQAFSLDVDSDHPATAELGAKWSWRDEVYLFRDLRPDARVLLRVSEDQLDLSVPEARIPAHGVPLAWCHEDGAGRTFYSALGHFPDAWERPEHLRYVNGALRWLLADGTAA